MYPPLFFGVEGTFCFWHKKLLLQIFMDKDILFREV